MWETQVQYLGQEDALEKGMETHSNILTLRIPWTELFLAGYSLWTLRVKHESVSEQLTLSLYPGFRLSLKPKRWCSQKDI